MKLEIGKKYKDRSGDVWHCVAANPYRTKYPFVCACVDGDSLGSWDIAGHCSLLDSEDLDLIEEYKEPQTGEFWVNVYGDDGLAVSWSKKYADLRSDSADVRIARIKVTYTEGQFDE